MAERDMNSDEELFAAFGRGAQDKLGELARRYEEPLFRFLYRRTGSVAQAEDLFQETWVSVIKGRRSYQEGRSFKAWLYSIALNLSRKAWRERPAPAPDPLGRLEPATHDTPTRTLARRETSAEVRKILDALPEAQRDVFLLFEYEGLSYAEIGEALGRPLGTVKSQMHYALLRVRAGLGRLWEDLP
jgi:RNA polymerase sigma-70 factor (ECF subfamily)